MNAPRATAAGPVTFSGDGYRLVLGQQGATSHSRVSYPVHCGRYHLLELADWQMHFNCNHEIIRLKRSTRDWPHPHEWLKRTAGNDWVYHSTGGYTGVFEATGEYYLPNFDYPSNSILGGHPFTEPLIVATRDGWHQALVAKAAALSALPEPVARFFSQVTGNGPEYLAKRAAELHRIYGGRISVLPPDCRQVQYQILPLTIARGCLYKCRFCKVKNKNVFQPLAKSEIRKQIEQLRQYFGPDLGNHPGIFLGEHDALAAPPELLSWTLEEASRELQGDRRMMNGPSAYLFGSVSSLLATPQSFFAQLQQWPGETFINIGLESFDQETLDYLGKPLKAAMVREAFAYAQEINDRYRKVEITANLLMDEDLPPGHYPAIEEVLRAGLQYARPKGSIYFSPVRFEQPSRSQLFIFNRLKVMSRLPAYLYIIQRL